jgi:hypothetical protein
MEPGDLAPKSPAEHPCPPTGATVDDVCEVDHDPSAPTGGPWYGT